ncbi:MAG: hypothetical protein WCW14_02830 [Candidatus Paceibacterota bacterium]|jgi:hypothetical protein
MTIGELREIAKCDPRLEDLLRSVFIEALKVFIEDLEYRIAILRGGQGREIDLTAFKKAILQLREECRRRGLHRLPMMTPSLVARYL